MSLFVKSHWHKRHLDDDDVLNGVILNMDTSDHIPVHENNIQDSSGAIEQPRRLVVEGTTIEEDLKLSEVPMDKPVGTRVTYNDMIAITTKLPVLLTSLDKDVQHLVYSHMHELHNMQSTGDPKVENVKGCTVEVLLSR